jgi:membrane associated rhomboid family serine protease
MKIEYNSPVILTYTLICVLVMLLSNFLGENFLSLFVLNPHGSFSDPLTYFRMISHIAGHVNWQHLVGNFALILLIGPILEEKYGSSNLLILILFTGLLTGILQMVFFSEGLLGASGIVFMLIMLSSFANFKAGTIPLTFILIAILYVGQEVYTSFQNDNISQFAHIIGGVCGGIFGFILAGNRKKPVET